MTLPFSVTHRHRAPTFLDSLAHGPTYPNAAAATPLMAITTPNYGSSFLALTNRMPNLPDTISFLCAVWQCVDVQCGGADKNNEEEDDMCLVIHRNW